MGRGPSLEVGGWHESSALRPDFFTQYEICHNLPTVDLLVSLAYSSAAGGVLEDPLPVNLGLRVKPPRTGSSIPVVGVDGLCDFDALDTVGVRGNPFTPLDTRLPVYLHWTETNCNRRVD